MPRAMIASLAVLGLSTGAALADSVDIQGVVGSSTEQTGATYSGSLEYNFIGGSTGELKVSLTNDTPASVGGFLTGFLFRADAVTGTGLSSANPSEFLHTGSESGAPFGTFDGGAALNGSFLGGGNPSDGLAVGESGMFMFSITSATASTISAADFLGSLNEPGFLVRFRGLTGGGSDKVPGGGFEVVVPLPGAGALAAAGLAFVGLRRRR
ncbi:MAG: hypothetical protein NCW75_09455 [Phycisphaera sp.]|nr:MAG: hypothetical protein NCW75_09455 [Phycisphaera sp.]